MNDLDVSMTAVVATVLWLIGVALALAELLTEHSLGALGMIAAAGGATLNVRCYFVRLEHRQANAFQLGRDYESSSRVHSVH